MKTKTVFLGGLVAATLLMSGCTQHFVDFTLMSSKNFDWSRASEYQQASHRVEGVDKIHIIIIIPTGMNLNIKEAMDQAIESVPGAVALVDGSITQKFIWIPFIYAQVSWVVEGTPLIDKKLVSTWTHGDDWVTRVNADGTIRETRTVTKDEYASIRSSPW